MQFIYSAKLSFFYTDLRNLIDFALDYTDLILVTLTDIGGRARNLLNIDDWENTLKLVRHGIQYQDRKWKQLEEQLCRKMGNIKKNNKWLIYVPEKMQIGFMAVKMRRGYSKKRKFCLQASEEYKDLSKTC